jgi:hypothetical protein
MLSGMATTIRTADVSDLPSIIGLIRERDDRRHPDAAVAGYLADLSPDRIAVWLAERDGDPIALNAIYLRAIATGSGTARAGYWGHLYVRPQSRKLMIYPQLVLAMLRWAKEHDLDWIYTATRQPDVAAAHLKLGFEKIATIPVLLKPLRPGTLMAYRLGGGVIAAAAGSVADLLWGAGAAVVRTVARGVHGFSRPAVTRGLDAAGIDSLETASANRIRTAWSADSWAARFRGTIEGEGYHTFVLPSTSAPAGLVMLRIAARGEPALRLAVLMDLADASIDNRFTPALFSWATDWAVRERADAIVALAPTSAPEAAAFRRQGFLQSSEQYALLVKPTSGRPLPDGFREPTRWRFTFAEHDAF